MVDLASLPPEEKERITRIIMEQHPILGIAFEDDVIVVNIAPGITPVLTSIDGFLIRYESFEINDLSFNTISPEIYSRVAHDVPEDAGPVPEPIPCLRCAHTVLRGGISISHPTVTAGTLGCIVYHNKTLRWEILSNHHVIATDAGVRGDAIYQPGNADATEPEWRQRKVAQLHRWVPIIRADIDEPFDPLTAPNDLDCAVAVPASNLKDLGISLSRSVIDPIGFPRGAKDAEVGMEVLKIGRCFTKNTLIMTNPRGPRTVQELALGDKVLTFDEKKHELTRNRITNIFYQGFREVWRLYTRNRTITVTDNHPFLIAERVKELVSTEYTQRTRNQTGYHGINKIKRNSMKNRWILKWKELRELHKGDVLVALDSVETNESESIGSDTARLLGFWIADGSASYKRGAGGRVNLYCANNTEALFYDSLLRKIFGRPTTVYPRKNYWIVACYSADVARFFLTQCRGKKLGKRIPDIIWRLPITERRAFIEGYCDGDGHRVEGEWTHYTFGSTNTKLIEQVRMLCIMSGIRVTNIHRYMKTGFKLSLNYEFSAYPDSKEPVMFGYDKTYGHYNGLFEQLNLPNGTHLERICGIEYLGMDDTYDIEVENSHNFFADGILAHNTTGVTYGEITSIDATVRVNPSNRTQVADYKNLIRTTPMVSGGDSGSLLVEVSTRMAVGLLFAGGYDRITGVPTGPSYACKMSRVMEALDISVVRPATTTADPLARIDADPILGGLLTGLTHGFLV